MPASDLNVGALIYMMGADDIKILVIGGGRDPQEHSVQDAAEITCNIHRLLEVLEGPALDSERTRCFEEFSRSWGIRLLPPASMLKSFDVLVIVPHHALHAVPFHAIWVPERDNYLGLATAVTYCSSATLFQRCVYKNPARSKRMGNLSEMTCAVIASDVRGNRTPDYGKVAELFAGFFPRSTQNVSRTTLKTPLNGAQPWNVICLVCHGYVDRLIPENSCLLFEDRLSQLQFKAAGDVHRAVKIRDQCYLFKDRPLREIPFEFEIRGDCSSDLLTVSELLYDPKFSCSAELVALFGCSSGASEIQEGDDVNSLANGWLKAGATSVLSALWTLKIEVVAAWLPTFLQKWTVEHIPKALAFQEATRHLIAGNSTLRPYDWASLQLSGDWF